ncbi:MAG: thiamine phosphate synthase [Dehalococcoidia bacterium]
MLRLIDANLDRLGEGLRVLEEISRFILGDIQTTETLKRMRHELCETDPEFKNQLLEARDSEGDVGRDSAVEGTERKHLTDLVTANARRTQEALRVLDEFARLPEAPSQINERNFEQARFTLYEIERKLTLTLSRQDKLEKLAGVYVIIDSERFPSERVPDIARRVIEGGTKVVQLRGKGQNKKDLLELAEELRRICTEAGIILIINDNVDIVLACDADGVHLGNQDLPVPAARQMLSYDKIIGRTVRTAKQALEAQAEGADYLGVGSVYPSPTKPDVEVIGLQRLGEIRNAGSLPIVAIGGINEGNAREVIEQGADCIAVIDSVLNREDIEAATRFLAEQFNYQSGS